MKKETEGYFVIKGKKTDWYITDDLFPSKNKEDTKPSAEEKADKIIWGIEDDDRGETESN